jgi:hypothetical protein
MVQAMVVVIVEREKSGQSTRTTKGEGMLRVQSNMVASAAAAANPAGLHLCSPCDTQCK